LSDTETRVPVIGVLTEIGPDAKAALPELQKLKTSPNDAVRNAAITAIAKIE